MKRMLSTFISLAVPLLLAGLFVGLTSNSAQAAPPFNTPGPPPYVPPVHTPQYVPPVQSVPIPATDLLFGVGLIALPWLRSKMKK